MSYSYSIPCPNCHSFLEPIAKGDEELTVFFACNTCLCQFEEDEVKNFWKEIKQDLLSESHSPYIQPIPPDES